MIPSIRAIGVYTVMSWSSDRSDLVFNAVKKAKKYGELSLPFIVTVGHATAFPEEDTETSLYETSVEHIHAGSELTFRRRSNGYGLRPTAT
jgi:hypothetical protein